MIDGARSPFRRARVRASWTILGLGALVQIAAFGLLDYYVLAAAAAAQAVAWMADAAPRSRPAGGLVFGVTLAAAIYGGLAAAFAAITAKLQRLALGRAPQEFGLDPLRGWTGRSAAAAALATFTWVSVTALWNNAAGGATLACVFTELIAGSALDVWAIVAVQRRLLSGAPG